MKQLDFSKQALLFSVAYYGNRPTLVINHYEAENKYIGSVELDAERRAEVIKFWDAMLAIDKRQARERRAAAREQK